MKRSSTDEIEKPDSVVKKRTKEWKKRKAKESEFESRQTCYGGVRESRVEAGDRCGTRERVGKFGETGAIGGGSDE